MQQKTCHKLIYKIHSKQLKRSKWNLDLDLRTVMRDNPEIIVSLNDSQILRFIDEINGVEDVSGKVSQINRRIRAEKKKPRSRETKTVINQLYESLYSLQFQKDYVCVIMDSNSDYDRANEGFSINGIKYRRFLGTNGGIKNSTIVYVNEDLYPELKARLDNGRNKEVPLVPAKLEAYQALICSGSTPLPQPKGIIVVEDCITHFTDDVIMINDEADGEPVMTFEKDFPIEHNDSDGYGLMLPSYSRRVNEYLTGDGGHTISGMNTRYAWTKGMVYTFDFLEFAEKVAGTYEITDAWGDKRDIRDAEVILTVSMLKLWNCYKSWEDYYENCEKNHYKFSASKITPKQLENVRDTNYQFLQSYTLTDEELQELCQPTIDEINDVLGLDYRKTLAFLSGFGLNENNVWNDNTDAYIKALMVDERMIQDPYVRRKVWNLIANRIEVAKRGTIRIHGNYAMISGDPYALCQSMFGLEITGLLKKQEIYHKYWIDRGATELVCFRAPMTCHNNIRKMKLCNRADVAHWYQYIETALIYNAFDTACDAMNGADKDGDTNMCTDNPILLKRTLNSPTIMCVQRKAEKKIVEEADIIQANKLAFNDDIGVVTNHVTTMIEVQSGFEPGSKEYETLSYRIMCGQLYQQNTIDRAKGIIAKPMPDYWYSYRANMPSDDDTEDDKARKEFNIRILAEKKPYFMIYVYPALKAEYKKYKKGSDLKMVTLYGKSHGFRSMEDVYNYKDKDSAMISAIKYYEKLMPVGTKQCVINRICRLFENAFSGFSSNGLATKDFDYRILKSDTSYSKKLYNEIALLYTMYRQRMNMVVRSIVTEKKDKYFGCFERKKLEGGFERECSSICTNEYELCNILLDLCYRSEYSKLFVWEMCGNTIIHNLLCKNNSAIKYPVLSENESGEFVYCGRWFNMVEKTLEEDHDDNFERT